MSALLDEAGNRILDEAGDPIFDEAGAEASVAYTITLTVGE